jgi:hypothetical protein
MKMADRLLQNGKIDITKHKMMVTEARKLLPAKNGENMPEEKLASPIPGVASIESEKAEYPIISSAFQNDSFYEKLIAILNRLDDIHKKIAISFYSAIGWKSQVDFWMKVERRACTNEPWQLVAQGIVATWLTVAIVAGVGLK